MIDLAQTWKKLQAVQAALVDILSKIMQFWGHFESKILHFQPKMEEEELKMDQGEMRIELWWMEDLLFRNEAVRVVD